MKQHASISIAAEWFCCLVVMLVLVQAAEAIIETRHMNQTDHQGNIVQMDISYDTEEKIVLVIVGDVSMYAGGVQTVNLHDYKTGYGVLKDINQRACYLARTLRPTFEPEKYRLEATNEVYEHMLRAGPDPISYNDVKVIGGEKLASFCKDYNTFLTVATPTTFKDRTKRETVITRKMWCFISACFW